MPDQKPQEEEPTAGDKKAERHLRYNAPLERAFYHVRTPFQELLSHQTASGLVLLVATGLALFAVNSPFRDEYHAFTGMDISLSVGSWNLTESLRLWVNDGLMGIFFLAVGLEIKREILVGELSSRKKAALPLIAAAGGMIVPAMIFILINPSPPASQGWGVPMATDIAFVIGVLSLLGPRIPPSMYIFLISLAIVDDLGAVVIIAIFYSKGISTAYLVKALVIFVLLLFFNFVGVRRPLPYYIVGALLWFAMLKSGVHATVAGVLVAITIPARSKVHPVLFGQRVGELIERYESDHKDQPGHREDDDQYAMIQMIKRTTSIMETPMHRILDDLRFPVAFLIMPIFAFMNAGIPIESGHFAKALSHPVTIGVMAGLVVGKFAGVMTVCAIAIKTGIASLPEGMDWRRLTGAAILTGIGFTMSMFIAALGFRYEPELLQLAKTGVLISSMAAGVLGYFFLRLSFSEKSRPNQT